MKKNVDALSIKPGPTESGVPSPSPSPPPVGGEILPVDKLSVFILQYWPIIVLMLLPFGLLLYKKRDILMRLLFR